MHGAMISCKTSFIVVLWSLPCCSLLFCLGVFCKYNWFCCCHFTILCIVQSSNRQPISNECLFLIHLTLFVMFHSTFLCLFCNFFHFGLPKFNVNFPMLFLFIYNFRRFEWWHCDGFATFNIATSFINNLFQMSSSLSFCFCWGLFLLF
jgi:hypothetical protein